MRNDSSGLGWNRLVPLFREILVYWRFIVIMGFGCALLAGCLQTVRYFSAGKASPDEIQATSEAELEREVYERGAETVRAKIESREEYLANSIIFKIDPYHTAIAEADIFFSSEMDGKLADAVTNCLRFFVRREIDWSELAEEEETEETYLRELVTDAVLAEDNVLNIKVRHYDEAKAEKILDYILEAVKKRDEELQEEIGSHSFTVLNKGVGSFYDSTYNDWAENNVNRIGTLQSILADYEQKLAGTAPTVSGISKKSIIKMFVYGGLGGGFAALLIIFIILLEKNRLLCPDELRDAYGIPVLAVFPRNRKRHAAFAFIDDLIAKIGCYPTESLTDRERYALISEKLKLLSGPVAGRKLALVGDVPEEILVRTAEGISSEMKDTAILTASKITTDPEAVRAVGESDAVILVAGRGTSRMIQLENDIDAVRDLGKKIAGGIVAC